ncbi:hypothetical protein ACFO0S_03750 [Chryseomicrobium palamuruense]|uniref:Uncharacterized protein n=1 Tax=Chryseomicrobium palamuruense TaxID=682973 RepID=A0ABV8USF0_9BACL
MCEYTIPGHLQWKAQGLELLNGTITGTYIFSDAKKWRFDIQMNDITSFIQVTNSDEKALSAAYDLFKESFPSINEGEFKEKLKMAIENQHSTLDTRP